MVRPLKKTAVIGIGGTGLKAVLHMKRRLVQTYGEVPPMIKFLVIDTADKEDLFTEGGITELSPGEFLKLPVRDPASLIATNSEVREWLPDGVPLFSLTTGAKQVRPLGRLAVFANASRLEAALEGLLSSLKDWGVERSEQYEGISEDIVVNLVCSLAGGTGSGCFFDVAVLTKSRLSSTDKIIGYFLMPDIFHGRATVENVEPNAYAAIREINSLFEKGKIRYTLGGLKRTAPQGMFNAVYLVNKTNRHGIEYNNERDLHEFLAVGMILQSTTTGKGAQDVLDNLEAVLIGKRWFGKPTVFSSFGVSELVYPGIWYADLRAIKLALRTIQTVFRGGDLSQVDDSTDDFIRQIGIREHEANDVIDALAEPSLAPKFPLPKIPRKTVLDEVLSRRSGFVHDAERQFNDKTLANLQRLKREKAELLEAEVNSRLDRPRGLEYTRVFLAALAGRIIEFRNEMVQERDVLDEQRDAVESRYASAGDGVKHAANSFFGTKGKIEEALKNFKLLVDQEVGLILELARRERAIDFFTFMLNEVEKAREEMESLLSYCEALTQEFHEDIERLLRGRREKKPFVEEITPKTLSDVKIDTSPDDFLKWLKQAGKGSLRALGSLRLEDFKSLMLEYANSDATVSEIRNLTIEEILRDLTPKEREKYIYKLDMMAAPLWQYDQGMIAGDKHTENIYLFGVEDADNSVFTAEKIRDAVSTPWAPNVISTGDSKRIVCFKVEAAVPAFVISHMSRYREKYLDPNRPFPYHLHKDWASTLPELFPGAEEEEARLYWSLALAKPFGLIIKRGQYYYLRSEKRGDRTKGYLVRLAQGRREALRALVQDHELVDEIKDAIEKVNEELGNKSVVESLKEYGEGLERQARKQGEEIRKQIELELDDIERYMESISAL